MSISCQQEITINVVGGVDAYWTFEELGTVNRVDKVHAIALVPTLVLDGGSGFLTNAAGIQGQGALYFLGGAGTGSQVPQMETAIFPGTAFLALQAGKGFSFAGWFFVFGDANQAQGNSWDLNFIDSLFNQLGDIQISLSANQVQLRITDSLGNTDSIFTALPLNAWMFFHMWFDPADSKVHLSLNNAASLNGTVALTFTPVGAGDTGQIFNFNSQYHCIQDEWAIKVSGIFTPAQQAYLYNGGLGRTWPLTLP